MKSFLLAAAAIIAVPAMAQQMPAAPADQTQPATTSETTTPAEPAMQAPPAPTGADTMTTTNGSTATGAMSSAASGDPAATDPAGGYQPSMPPMQGTPAAGATVRFQAAADPNTAFPPPPPMKSYPICKKGQYDNCMQRGGR